MDRVDVIIETPKGSKFKYKYDKKKEVFKVNKLLPAGLAFPYDFGFIPGSKGEDGDPLDVMIISEDSFCQGSLLECEILCSLEAEQTSQDGKTVRNDRIFVIPAVSLQEDAKVALREFSKTRIKQIQNFFVYYNKEEGKEFRPLGIVDAPDTWENIKKKL